MIEINNQNENFPEATQIQETVLSINDIEENRDYIRNTVELYSVINPKSPMIKDFFLKYLSKLINFK